MENYFKNNLLNETTEYNFLKRFHVLVEHHTFRCDCSYCKEPLSLVQLRLPKCRKWNSWRVIAIKLGLNKYYIRWTLPHDN